MALDFFHLKLNLMRSTPLALEAAGVYASKRARSATEAPRE